MCLPIIHFLGGSLQPYKELDYGNFREKEKEWWLIPEFESEKEEQKLREWSRYSIIVLSFIILITLF